MTKNQRFVVLALLSLVLFALIKWHPTALQIDYEQRTIIYSTLFLLSFTALLLEHFFSRPTDVLATAVSILLLLIPSARLLESWGTWYSAVLYYEIVLVVASTGALLLLEDGPDSSLRNRISRVLHAIAVRTGGGVTQYLILAVIAIVFFVEPRSTPFVALLGYAIIVAVVRPQRIAEWLPSAALPEAREVGEIIGVEGDSSVLLRLYPGSRQVPAVGSLVEFQIGSGRSAMIRCAVIVQLLHLDDGLWARAVGHKSLDALWKELPRISRHKIRAVYNRPDADCEPFLGELAGFVAEGSTIGTLRFIMAGRFSVNEGDLVQVGTSDGPVLYQVVNGWVKAEALESRNEADVIMGEAIQLGRWNPHMGMFERFGWVPSPRLPVTKVDELSPPVPTAGELAIGAVPGTNISVLLDRDTAMSHHTAVLGVTGVGKSVFARDLVRRLVAPDVRIIVVDFTREWKGKFGASELPLVVSSVQASTLHSAVEELGAELAKFRNQQDAGRIAGRKATISQTFKSAIHEVVAAEDPVRVFELPELSNTEGVLEYTKFFFQEVFNQARDGALNGKRMCIVLEEAHTVVPEWNFTGLADKASQALVNNISQIALQGRKFGIGFVVIAQRTANVSKTVLTQCNTVIAFQCYDGTSLEFLSHYLPPQLVKALPSLPPRHAVAVGKAVRGSVPLIFQVPDLSSEEAAAIEPVQASGGGAAAAAAIE